MANDTTVVDVLDLRGAAEFLRCGPKAVKRLVRLRQIPCRQINIKGSLRFSRTALEEWLRSGKAK